MGYSFFVALGCAVFGTIPLLVARKTIGAIIQGSVSLFVLWGILYFATPSTVWPLFGLPGFCVFVLWIIDGAFGMFSDDVSAIATIPAAIWAALYLGSIFLSTGLMRSSDYQTMIGSVETRIWTQDVQPKDPRHMRMSTKDNAIYLAQKAVGQDGAIGSQFQIEDGEFTLQLVNGELWYVAPLEFKGFAAWNSTGVSPGYVMVSAENPDLQPKFVTFSDDQRMKYSPSAYFDHNLERHLRTHGYLNKGLTDFSFEVDENHRAWWVVTVYMPTIMWDGEKVEGVAIVDPATGDIVFYPTANVPAWVDRVIPQDFVKSYITWWGEYAHGWLNSMWAEKDIVKPGDSTLVYGNGEEPQWVTDISASSSKDNSLIGVMYTSTRTGKSVFYSVPGGGTNAAILKAVGDNEQISYRKLHGADPQLYNVYGSMACVVPLFNDSHAFQGVAIVPINNVQLIATGSTQYEALRQYEKLLSDKGEKVALGKDRTLKTAEGVIDRINADMTSKGSIYYFHIPGIQHLFTAGSGDSPKLPVTQKGDKVRVEYYDSDRDVVPLRAFDNLSLPLTESSDQKQVRTEVSEKRESQDSQEDSRTVQEEVKKLSPQQLDELKKHLPSKQ